MTLDTLFKRHLQIEDHFKRAAVMDEVPPKQQKVQQVKARIQQVQAPPPPRQQAGARPAWSDRSAVRATIPEHLHEKFDKSICFVEGCNEKGRPRDHPAHLQPAPAPQQPVKTPVKIAEVKVENPKKKKKKANEVVDFSDDPGSEDTEDRFDILAKDVVTKLTSSLANKIVLNNSVKLAAISQQEDSYKVRWRSPNSMCFAARLSSHN